MIGKISSRNIKFYIIPFATLIGVLAIFGAIEPRYLSTGNIITMLGQIAPILTIGLAATFPILIGSIDLSVVGILFLSCYLSASFAEVAEGFPIVGVLAAFAAAIAFGVFNGLALTKLKVPSFLTTLASLALTWGTLMLLAGGITITFNNPAFKILGSGFSLGLPNNFIVAIAAFVIIFVLQSGTIFGRHLYAVGSGETVSNLSGVRVNNVKFFAFVVSGLLAGLTGVLYASRLGGAPSDLNFDWLLQSVMAVALGGTALSGGVGGVHRTLLGAVTLGALLNGLNVINVHPFDQMWIKGIVVMVMIVLTIDREKVPFVK